MTFRHALLAAYALGAASLAAAHHSPAMFDMTTTVVIEGTVKKVVWGNPHTYMEIETVDAGGQPVVQNVEAGPTAVLFTGGVTTDSVRAGERVTLRAAPHRRGPGNTVLGLELTKADGTALPLHVRAIRAPARTDAIATSIAGTWVSRSPEFVNFGDVLRASQLTDAGRAARASSKAAADAARSTCVPYGPPPLMLLPVATVVETSDEAVTFALDWMNARRVVHLNAEHPRDLEPSLLGHSIGRWEGGALIVDTVGFTAQAEGLAFDFPSSAAKHVRERFAVAAGGKQLDYEVTVEDPEYFAAPITYRAQWDYRPEQQSSGMACDPKLAAQFTQDE
ncbi:MAG TPA: DUF6152 family protein [Gammaproteobacteria bacterium]